MTEVTQLPHPEPNPVDSVVLGTEANRVALVLTPYRKMGVRRRKQYAQKVIAHCIDEYDAFPIAVHRLVDDVLVPGDGADDARALSWQRTMIGFSDLLIVGIDYGVSDGMRDAIKAAEHCMTIKIHYVCVGLVADVPRETDAED